MWEIWNLGMDLQIFFWKTITTEKSLMDKLDKKNALDSMEIGLHQKEIRFRLSSQFKKKSN